MRVHVKVSQSQNSIESQIKLSEAAMANITLHFENKINYIEENKSYLESSL